MRRRVPRDERLLARLSRTPGHIRGAGNMCLGIVGSELMIRVGPDAYETAVALPNAREMDFTGRSMRGMV